MMNDEQYLLDLFEMKFRRYKHKNIVLYGLQHSGYNGLLQN